MKDIISIFNRLTDPQLADCKLLYDLLENHYDKFKYFYFMLIGVELKDIDQITCKVYGKQLCFDIYCNNKKEAQLYLNRITNYLSEYEYIKNYFEHEVTLTANTILVTISCKLDSEEEVYEKRYSLL